MKKKIKVILIIGLIILGIFIVAISCRKVEEKQDSQTTNSSKNEIDEVAVEELKKESGITAENKLYDVTVEYDGTKVLNINPGIQYKIAFAGIIKNEKINIEEIDNIFKNYYPKKSGIWIEPNSRTKFLEMLKKETNNEYEITKEGYLEIKSENKSNYIDSEIKEMIENDKEYIGAISGIYYEADVVTGEILDNFYEDMDPCQATKTVNNNEDTIIFLSPNSQKMLSEEDILQELISCK